MSIYGKRYRDSDHFLKRNDRNQLQLTGPAAVEACIRAADANLAVGGVEGGRWLNPGFQARLDSIWARGKHVASREEAHHYNLLAAEFIRKQMQASPDPNLPPADVFILTAKRIDPDTEVSIDDER